jgi:hypothetical protein
MFNLTDKDKAEYEAANTEDDLANNIIKDCKLHGLVLINKVYE